MVKYTVGYYPCAAPRTNMPNTYPWVRMYSYNSADHDGVDAWLLRGLCGYTPTMPRLVLFKLAEQFDARFVFDANPTGDPRRASIDKQSRDA